MTYAVLIIYGLGNSQLLRYSLDVVQAQIFITASLKQLLEWHLIAKMVEFQSTRHINVLDVEKNDFNKSERKLSMRVNVVIYLLALYHVTEIFVAVSLLYPCYSSDNDCSAEEDKVFDSVLYCDITVCILCFAYFGYVLVKLWRQTYKKFRFEF